MTSEHTDLNQFGIDPSETPNNGSLSVTEHWRRQSEIYQRLNAIGTIGSDSMQRYMQELHNAIGLERIFRSTRAPGIIACMDEGIPSTGTIRAAGSGILKTPRDLRAFIDKAQPSGITAHMGCGAAALAYRQEFGPDAPTDQTLIDRFGIEFAMDLARTEGIPFLGTYNFGDSQDHTLHMDRPSNLHPAISATFDGTGMLDVKAMGNLSSQLLGSDPSEIYPLSFVVNRGHELAKNALAETQVALQIAFGGHGLNNFFTEETPFMLIPVGVEGHPERSLEKLQKELRPLAQPYGKRVVIDGFQISETLAMQLGVI